jgi:hypothetical protein
VFLAHRGPGGVVAAGVAAEVTPRLAAPRSRRPDSVAAEYESELPP